MSVIIDHSNMSAPKAKTVSCLLRLFIIFIYCPHPPNKTIFVFPIFQFFSKLVSLLLHRKAKTQVWRVHIYTHMPTYARMLCPTHTTLQPTARCVKKKRASLIGSTSKLAIRYAHHAAVRTIIEHQPVNHRISALFNIKTTRYLTTVAPVCQVPVWNTSRYKFDTFCLLFWFWLCMRVLLMFLTTVRTHHIQHIQFTTSWPIYRKTSAHLTIITTQFTNNNSSSTAQ